MKNLKFSLFFMVSAIVAVATFTACKDEGTDTSAKNEMTVDGVATEIHPAVYFRQSDANSSENSTGAIILLTTKDLVITPAQTELEDASMNGSGYMSLLLVSAPVGTTDWTHTYSLTQEETIWAFGAQILKVKNTTSEMGADFEKSIEWGAAFESGTLDMKKIGADEYEITLSGVCVKRSIDEADLGKSNFTLKYKGKVLNQRVGIGSVL